MIDEARRIAAERGRVVAIDLSPEEYQDRWHELVDELHGGPHCMGGGWSTLVLADHPYSWEQTPFGSARNAAERGRTRKI
ncbi:hypothetical protein [Dactylosporangium sp. NPDC005555]|uniref:hypothetical protein n=1 Tax=Dactylosporangium sp. NPDC005555 TaxID=3154889 RepID=UPI0033B966AA